MTSLGNGVFACSISESNFPERNEAGEPLALYCNRETGNVFLIQDHQNYRIYEALVPDYLELDEEGRNYMKQAFDTKYEFVRRAMEVLDKVVDIRLAME